MNKNFEIHTGQKERKEYIALTSVQNCPENMLSEYKLHAYGKLEYI